MSRTGLCHWYESTNAIVNGGVDSSDRGRGVLVATGTGRWAGLVGRQLASASFERDSQGTPERGSSSPLIRRELAGCFMLETLQKSLLGGGVPAPAIRCVEAIEVDEQPKGLTRGAAGTGDPPLEMIEQRPIREFRWLAGD